MSSPEHQEKLKEEAKAITIRLDALLKDTDAEARMVRTICIYAGMITETLVEYEEPDIVMEQAFHRISDLLHADPAEGDTPDALMPLAWTLDRDTELGRQLGRGIAKKLPKGLDDIHEIAIAMIINDFPVWEKKGYPRERLLRVLIEGVILSLTFEMATQDFCDLLIEEFIADGNAPGEGIVALSAVAGHYYALAEMSQPLPTEAEQDFTNVMVRESIRHGTPGIKNWGKLSAANDTEGKNIPEYLARLKPEIEEFFVLIGLDDPLGRAVSVAKSVGRMVAVVTVEDVGQIHPSIAKSLAKTGMILGAKYRDEAIKA
ncbi:MAG TPA: hypothetical protein VEF76_13200 [Patescibacteria group bacterium]|nr:hypothetical protein [Patescibacteria group bacterium]